MILPVVVSGNHHRIPNAGASQTAAQFMEESVSQRLQWQDH